MRFVVAACAGIVAAWAWSNTPCEQRAPPTNHPALEVISTVERRVVPDHMTWSVTAHAHARRELDHAVAAARAFVLAHGVAEAELTIDPAREAQPDYAETEWHQGLDVSSSDVARVERAYRALEAAALADLELDAGLSCTAAATPVVSQDAISAARKQARLRAARAILDYGGVPGSIVEANEGRADTIDRCPIEVTATAIAKFEID